LPERVFKSKVDGWIRIVLILAVVIELTALTAAAIEAGEPLAVLLFLAAGLLGAALFVSVLVGTHYTVDRDTLKIVSGPFRWRVPLADLLSLQQTRNPVSSPALSLDRLRIRYGRNRFGQPRQIMVSPEDQKRFLKAIGRAEADAR